VRDAPGCDHRHLYGRSRARPRQRLGDRFEAHVAAPGVGPFILFGQHSGEGELAEEATAEDSSVVRSEGGRGVRRTVKHYSLDAVIFVVCRVNSARGTLFRPRRCVSSRLSGPSRDSVAGVPPDWLPCEPEKGPPSDKDLREGGPV
jgi:hypothetical protein